MVWTNPRTFEAGELIDPADLNVHIRDNLNFLKERVQAGTVTITPSGSGPTSLPVTFPTAFSSAPKVVVSPATNLSATVVLGAAVSGQTTTGFTAWVNRTNTTPTPVRWVATLLDV